MRREATTMTWIHTGTISTAPAAILLVRLLVGGVFLSEGIQKFLFPDELGVGRFLKIGIPAPHIMAPFGCDRNQLWRAPPPWPVDPTRNAPAAH